MTRRLAALIVIASVPARAAEPVTARFASEPSVRELQQVAARVAEVAPERVRSWLRRASRAALLPELRATVGRGYGELTKDATGQPIFTTSDSWRFEVQATWQLDRLIFDRNELRVSREAQRVGARREELLTRIAQLYFARRRLQLDEALQPDAPGNLERALEIEELTAVLDGLTDGAMSRGRATR
jgi:outer membrane protein TolC